jgi:hypothetical protein
MSIDCVCCAHSSHKVTGLARLFSHSAVKGLPRYRFGIDTCNRDG